MMANPEKDTLDGTSMNNGAPANAGAPDGKLSSEGSEKSAGKKDAAAGVQAQDARATKATAHEEDAEAAATVENCKGTQIEAEAGDETAGDEAAGMNADTNADAAIADEAMAKAAAELVEWKDKYIRLHAEWDTYRRRIAEQREEEKARAAEKLVTSLLPVLDDLERTIDYAEKNGEQGLLSGVQAVLAKFVDILQKDGVQVLDPKGEEFNALEEQAVGTVEDASQPDETVAEVYQKGYKMGNKVLRPAMVTVTSGGPKREKTEE